MNNKVLCVNFKMQSMWTYTQILISDKDKVLISDTSTAALGAINLCPVVWDLESPRKIQPPSVSCVYYTGKMLSHYFLLACILPAVPSTVYVYECDHRPKVKRCPLNATNGMLKHMKPVLAFYWWWTEQPAAVLFGATGSQGSCVCDFAAVCG